MDLYNDYVCPWARWGIALEMVEIANYSDAAYIRQLWDVYLRQVCLNWAPALLTVVLSLLP